MRSPLAGTIKAWPPLPPQVWLRRTRRERPFPLADPGCRLYRLARHALWNGLGSLGLGTGDGVLVPAWHHGSEVECFLKRGLDVRFYAGAPDLAPDAAELEGLLDERTRALHLIHYLGFPQDVLRWRAWCDERGLLLIEDAAQAWLAGAPVGRHGDIAIWSLYKAVGLPDGGALRCHALMQAPPGSDGTSARGAGETAALHLSWLRGRLPARALDDPGPYDPLEDFALGDVGSRPSRITLVLLRRVQTASVAAARRENFRRLAARVGEWIPEPFGALPDAASPWVLPVEAPDKAAVLARLRSRGIDALDVWSLAHPALPSERFPAAAYRRAHTIGLPVHQELRARDVDAVALALLAGAPR